jgi:glucose-fructose oxidoreductase
MKRNDPVRFAVVGLGHIAQVAVLPAFKNAENCQLTALVSDNAAKSREVAEMYGVEHVVDYERYDALLASGEVDAVYIALPNSMHCEYAERAARAGVHVLCEKPMAVTEDECKRMITAAERNGVKLMIAYRLHFEEANLQAVEIVKSGRIGEPRVFSSTFTMQVEPGNVRVRPELGGGTLYDIGIYCINAARYLFRDEPIEAIAASFNGGDPRFEGVDEATSAILRFPGDRTACFTSSFGVESVSGYRIVGTKGDLRAEPAYDYSVPLKQFLTIDGKTKEQSFPKRDQFAPELIEFASCIREDREPEPNGLEGLADVRIIEAIYRSAMERRPIHIPAIHKLTRPEPEQAMRKPAVKKPRLVGVESPSGD